MRRRSAKKSRHGCKECKRRHVKCDETRPSCANCNVRHSPCSFTSSLAIPRRPASTIPSPRSSSSAASGSPQADEISVGQRSTVSTPLPDHHHDTSRPVTPLLYNEPVFTACSLLSKTHTFELHHLELLHNFRTGVLRAVFVDSGTVEGVMDMTVREAVRVPYLMDQVLALSAANLSITRSHRHKFYRDEATHLQTRGITLFNAVYASSQPHNDLASFVFSTLLSQQVLFDAFHTRVDFPTFLDRLVRALHISGGVRLMCGRSWPFIIAQYREQAGINMPAAYIAHSGAKTIFTEKLDLLEALFADENMSPSISTPCKDALGFLRDLSYARDRPRNKASRAASIIQWAVIVPAAFIRLIEQRRPEALIITAYYALLVHRMRGDWMSGDGGAFIVRSVTKFLGSYWAEWLAWPNEVVDSTEVVDGREPFSPIDITMPCRIDEVS